MQKYFHLRHNFIIGKFLNHCHSKIKLAYFYSKVSLKRKTTPARHYAYKKTDVHKG